MHQQRLEKHYANHVLETCGVELFLELIWVEHVPRMKGEKHIHDSSINYSRSSLPRGFALQAPHQADDIAAATLAHPGLDPLCELAHLDLPLCLAAHRLGEHGGRHSKPQRVSELGGWGA